MAENSKIEWCDHTSSPWHGCTKISPGCEHCYAEAMSGRNPGVLGVWGNDGVRVKSKSFVSNLRQWNKLAAKQGKSVKVFPSLCDPFEDRPELVPWREEMFAVIDECPNVTLLLLTKRPENIRRMIPDYSFNACASGDCPHQRQSECSKILDRENVWLLTSVENQEQADIRIPELLKCRDLSPVLGLSCEPLLGPLKDLPSAIDWIICGGESGPQARPLHPDWARSLMNECQAAEIPFFFKQWGEWYPLNGTGTALSDESDEINPFCWVDTTGNTAQSGSEPEKIMVRIGKQRAGRLLDGREWSELPIKGLVK